MGESSPLLPAILLNRYPLLDFYVTTTGRLSGTGAGNPDHWLARDPTSSLNRTGTGQKFCTGEIIVSVVTMLGVLSSLELAVLGG